MAAWNSWSKIGLDRQASLGGTSGRAANVTAGASDQWQWTLCKSEHGKRAWLWLASRLSEMITRAELENLQQRKRQTRGKNFFSLACEPLYIMSPLSSSDFAERINGGEKPAKVFQFLESILCDNTCSRTIREQVAQVIVALIQLNWNIFVWLELMGSTLKASISMGLCRSIKVLTSPLALVQSPWIDEIESLRCASWDIMSKPLTPSIAENPRGERPKISSTPSLNGSSPSSRSSLERSFPKLNLHPLPLASPFLSLTPCPCQDSEPTYPGPWVSLLALEGPVAQLEEIGSNRL
ncbi:hypothetical protein NL676_025345 [Syzygium grande]|nr:hypothetical protein NL676_025345 [Syzygium grande]